MKRTVLWTVLLCLMCLLESISRLSAATVRGSGMLRPTAAGGRRDSVAVAVDSVPRTRKDNYWRRLLYGHEDRTFEKRLDVSFAFLPSYAWETGLGLGGMATGLYRLDRTDSLMPPSDAMLSGSVTLRGAYLLTAEGHNYFKGRRSRLSWLVSLQNKPLDFWGISRAACDVNPVNTRADRYRPVSTINTNRCVTSLSVRGSTCATPGR